MMMKFFIFLQTILLIALFSTITFAQDKNKIKVSPQILTEDSVKNCDDLNVGRIAFSVPPRYPTEAKSAKIGGTVSVKVKIDENGNVSDILDVRGHKLLKKPASEATNKLKFTPTVCDGIPKPVTGLITYNFSPFVFTESYFIPKSINDFSDITKDSVYYEAIYDLTEKYKLAFGHKDKKFRPNFYLTKGEFIYFLHKTIDLLQQKAKLANKDSTKFSLINSYNPQKIKSIKEIRDIDIGKPFAESIEFLLSKHNISFVDEDKKFRGKLPLTNNEIIDYWSKVFGKDAIPVNFEKIQNGDRVFTRGEFALFLQESLYVLSYKVLP